ncbi:TPA: phage protein NinX family protein [Morganella morganii]
MNKYRDKSDFEINLRVAQIIFTDSEYDVIKQSMEVVKFQNGSGKGICHVFDPCNNPADAMPIIIDNKITVAYDKLYETWCAHVGSVMGDGDWDYSIEPAINYCDDNYYRAAMICFLMMKDAENES